MTLRPVVRWLLVSMSIAVASCGEGSTAAEGPSATTAGDGTAALLGGEEPEARGDDLAPEQGVLSEPNPEAYQLADGSCCNGADCVCRGGDPTRETINRNGPFRFASYSFGFNSVGFGGGTIFYPVDAEPPYSGVVMCPGFLALKSSISGWGPFFASHGIVLMVIDTLTVVDQVIQRAPEMNAALASLKAENNRAGSPLRGKMSADRYGLSGWSMGGGATWIITANRPEIKTAVTLAGHNLTAGGAISSLGSRVPTLMMNGGSDVTILGGLGQTQSAYDAIPNTTPKMLYVMALDGHFSWGTPTTNGGASGRYMMAWQKTFLEGDTRYRQFLLERGPLASNWETNVR
jgi:dienelactone hydrolase